MPTDTLELRDIHLPDPVSWWPPAIGWWVLLLVLILLIFFAVWLRKRWLEKRRSGKVLARKELDRIQHRYQQSQDPHQLITELSMLLRRTCLSLFPRSECAGLTGTDWLQFLDRVMQDNRFTQGAGQTLINAPYAKKTDINSDDLITLCKDWIEALP